MELIEILTDDIEFMGLFSLSNHSIFGVGIPLAIQSIRAPRVWVKSNREGGSKLNVGPILLSYDVVVKPKSRERKKSIIIFLAGKSMSQHQSNSFLA